MKLQIYIYRGICGNIEMKISPYENTRIWEYKDMRIQRYKDMMIWEH